MKALTICQPYAELIMLGKKFVENRTWPTSYRGPLYIHAGKSRQWIGGDNYGIPESELVFGAIVGTAELVACMPIDSMRQISREQKVWNAGLTIGQILDHEHAEGPVCWVLKDVHRFEYPVPYRGAQGLFDIPEAEVLSLMIARA